MSLSEINKLTEIVSNELTFIDACGQLCIDTDSVRRGVRKAFDTQAAEIERLRASLARLEPSEAVVGELRAMIAVMELEHARTCAGRVCDCDLEDTRGHRVRSARAAIAAYEGERK